MMKIKHEINTLCFFFFLCFCVFTVETLHVYAVACVYGFCFVPCALLCQQIASSLLVYVLPCLLSVADFLLYTY